MRNIKKQGLSHRYFDDNGKKGKSVNSVVLDTTAWADVEDFIGSYIIGTSYEEARALAEKCNEM